MSSGIRSTDEWPNLSPASAQLGVGRLDARDFASMLACVRKEYQEVVDAVREWRQLSDALRERYDDGSKDGRIKYRQAMIESITLRDVTNRRDFHLMMHRMVADQMALEFNYQMFVEDSTRG